MSRVTAPGSECDAVEPAAQQTESPDGFSKAAYAGPARGSTADWPPHPILMHVREAHTSIAKTDPARDGLHVARAKNRLYFAKRLEEVVAAVRSAGLISTSDRLDYLCKLPMDDPDDRPIDLESLRRCAAFMMEKWLPNPLISISPDGLVSAEWDMPDRSSLALEFRPSGDVRFSMIHETSHRNASGKLPHDDAMRVIQPYMDRLKGKTDKTDDDRP